MLISDKKILMISTMGINDLPTRKQRIARKLSLNNEVIYLQAPLTLLGVCKTRAKIRSFVLSQEKNLCVVQPPAILPFGLKVGFFHRINSIYFRTFVQKLLKKKQFAPDILWFYLPDFPDLATDYPQAITVYDCVDDHASYPGLRNPAFVRKLEQQLTETSNVIFATTHELAERLRKSNKNVYCIPNGVDWDHFGAKAYTEMKEQSGIPHPRVGYLGAIHHWFDLDLIKYLLDALPEIHLVIAGPKQRADLTALSEHPSLHLLGRVSVEQAPSCIEAWDVCLIPFIPNDLTLNISPLKFFEYCSRGKPTVSIPIQQLKQYEHLCYLYHDHNSCVDSIRKALSEAPDLKQERRKLAQQHSWEGKLQEMFQHIANMLG
jgi:glycosyltransferase involved in cell wall biosynthesis